MGDNLYKEQSKPNYYNDNMNIVEERNSKNPEYLNQNEESKNLYEQPRSTVPLRSPVREMYDYRDSLYPPNLNNQRW